MLRAEHRRVLRAMANADTAYYQAADLAPAVKEPSFWVYGRLKELAHMGYVSVLPDGAGGIERSYVLSHEGAAIARETP
jgi:hypothetical protein